jgi:uncharacterized protein (DUF1800 family)
MFARNLALLAALLAAPGIWAAPAVPTDDDAVRHALNRLTYGVRPGDVERVRTIGLQRWIDQQLDPGRIDNSALERRLASLQTLTLDVATIQREYAGPAMQERRERQLARRDGDRDPGSPIPDPIMRQPTAAQRKNRQVLTDLEEAKLLRAIYSERQLEEVLVDFWFNHFNVFAGKGQTRNYISAYERDVIRAYVFGSFRDMLGASAQHPAMLFYLDNWLSSGAAATGAAGATRAAGVTGAARARRSSGLNENYARELLELHTLGVDGGYTQDDIIHVARAFTGWTMRPREGTGFLFVPTLHDRNDKTVLGQAISGGGIREGEQVLDIVAAHPSTARHIATKLTIKFVSDTPPPALVDRAAARFTATGGHLREVVETIITSPEFFAADARTIKIKTPLDFIVSALRVTNAEVRNSQPLVRTLGDMGMAPYLCQPPTGYDDTAAAWVNAGALVARMNFAIELSKNQVRGVRIPLSETARAALEIGAPAFQRQ